MKSLPGNTASMAGRWRSRFHNCHLDAGTLTEGSFAAHENDTHNNDSAQQSRITIKKKPSTRIYSQHHGRKKHQTLERFLIRGWKHSSIHNGRRPKHISSCRDVHGGKTYKIRRRKVFESKAESLFCSATAESWTKNPSAMVGITGCKAWIGR